jgi:hypothetical protein
MKKLVASLVAMPLLAGSALAGTLLGDRQLDSVTAGTPVLIFPPVAAAYRIDDFIVTVQAQPPCDGTCPTPGLSATSIFITPHQTIVTQVNTGKLVP